MLYEKTDALIIETLRDLVPSAALSYQQALDDLQDQDRLSWRGPATDLREALRETLDHLAPDDDVSSEQAFKLVAGTSGPTMKQKVRFVLKNRDGSRDLYRATENAVEAVDELMGSFVRSVYTKSNISTHAFSDRGEVQRLKEFVRVAFCELLELG